MKIEYSNKGVDKFAFSFTKAEKKCLSEAVAVKIKRLEKQVERVNNNPRNEGQATYLEKINQLVGLKKFLIEFNEAIQY